jgi:uncharacterized caspase-like protein
MPAVLRLLRLLAAVSCLLVAGVTAAAPGKAQVALVVGIGAYQNAPPLPNPPNDARALAESLKKLGFQVELAVDPDKARLEQAIKRFGDQLQGAKVGLFFYAGHGLQVNGRNFLVPADAKIDNERSLPFAAVDADLVLTQMETSTPVSLIFLDACRDNPFSRSLARSMGTRSSAVGRGLAQIAAGEGSLIVFATQPGNVAEDGQTGHSPFTEALLKNLTAPGLEVRQMLTRVRLQVKEQTNGKQIPWDHSSLTQDYFFMGPTTVIVQPQAAPAAEPKATGVDPMAVQLSLWESVRSSQDPADFEDYLKQYPDGKFAAIARRRLAALKTASLKEREPAPQPPPSDTRDRAAAEQDFTSAAADQQAAAAATDCLRSDDAGYRHQHDRRHHRAGAIPVAPYRRRGDGGNPRLPAAVCDRRPAGTVPRRTMHAAGQDERRFHSQDDRRLLAERLLRPVSGRSAGSGPAGRLPLSVDGLELSARRSVDSMAGNVWPGRRFLSRLRYHD